MGCPRDMASPIFSSGPLEPCTCLYEMDSFLSISFACLWGAIEITRSARHRGTAAIVPFVRRMPEFRARGQHAFVQPGGPQKPLLVHTSGSSTVADFINPVAV